MAGTERVALRLRMGIFGVATNTARKSAQQVSGKRTESYQQEKMMKQEVTIEITMQEAFNTLFAAYKDRITVPVDAVWYSGAKVCACLLLGN